MQSAGRAGPGSRQDSTGQAVQPGQDSKPISHCTNELSGHNGARRGACGLACPATGWLLGWLATEQKSK